MQFDLSGKRTFKGDEDELYSITSLFVCTYRLRPAVLAGGLRLDWHSFWSRRQDLDWWYGASFCSNIGSCVWHDICGQRCNYCTHAGGTNLLSGGRNRASRDYSSASVGPSPEYRVPGQGVHWERKYFREHTETLRPHYKRQN